MASQDHGIHSFKECVLEGSDYLHRFCKEWTQEEDQIIIREENMGETEDQALTIQRRSLKKWWIWRTKFLKNLLSMLIIWIRNDVVMNEEYDESIRRSPPTEQMKIIIQFSFHDIVLLCICLYSVDVLCIIECLH